MGGAVRAFTYFVIEKLVRLAEKNQELDTRLKGNQYFGSQLT
jgi:hypothetical protein